MERNGIHIINLYKTAKIEEANEALKKSLHQVEKYYLYYKSKQKTSLLKSKSCKHALHY
jgi:small subunit ribosomal protein S2